MNLIPMITGRTLTLIYSNSMVPMQPNIQPLSTKGNHYPKSYYSFSSSFLYKCIEFICIPKFFLFFSCFQLHKYEYHLVCNF